MNNKSSGIYKITNLINNKVYIGSSIHIKKRKYRHFYLLDNNKHDNGYLQQAYNKYGKDNFTFEIIEYIDIDNILIREQYWINILNSCDRKHGYNLLPTAGNWLGYKHSDITKLKISKSKKGISLSDIAKQNMRKAKKDKPMTNSQINHLKDITESNKKKIINITTGNIFNSIKEAKDYYNIKGNSHIGEVCRGKRKTEYGFKWAFYDNYLKDKNKNVLIENGKVGVREYFKKVGQN